MAREWDEDDVRIRPSRHGSRRRSKRTPEFKDAIAATVTGVDRGRFNCELADGTEVIAVKSRNLGRKGLVVGDRVLLTGDTSGDSDTLARVVKVQPRASMLRRSADDDDGTERPLVANADQLAIVVAAADPEPRHGFVDRCLIAAYDAGIRPLLVVTKTDVRDPEDFLRAYQALDVPVVRTSPTADLSLLANRLQNLTTVFIGHSGVGKSTLVNRLVPAAQRDIGRVNTVTGRGRHTSTSAVMFDLPGGGHIIDTPGVRSFGLHHVTPDNVIASFTDLVDGTLDCPRSCSHDEPDCALDAWVAAGHVPAERLLSLRRILKARTEPETY